MGTENINELAKHLTSILDSKIEPRLTEQEANVLNLFLKASGTLTPENSNKLLASLNRVENLSPKSHSFIRNIVERIFPRPSTTPFSHDDATAVMIHCTKSLDPETYKNINLREDLNKNKPSSASVPVSNPHINTEDDVSRSSYDADVESSGEESTDGESADSDLTSHNSLTSLRPRENSQEELTSETGSHDGSINTPESKEKSKPFLLRSQKKSGNNFELGNPHVQGHVKKTAQSLSDHAQEIKRKNKEDS